MSSAMIPLNKVICTADIWSCNHLFLRLKFQSFRNVCLEGWLNRVNDCNLSFLVHSWRNFWIFILTYYSNLLNIFISNVNKLIFGFKNVEFQISICIIWYNMISNKCTSFIYIVIRVMIWLSWFMGAYTTWITCTSGCFLLCPDILVPISEVLTVSLIYIRASILYASLLS